MKARTPRLLFVVAILAVLSSIFQAAHALVYSADVRFDFVKGWIKITPPEYRIGANSEGLMKSSGFGISFNFFQWQTEIADLSADSYIFLDGDPDRLTFQLVQYLCRSDSNGPYGALATRWTFVEPRGRIEVASQFITGPALRANSNLENVCTDKYRELNSNFNFRALAAEVGPFQQRIEKKSVVITWNAKGWKDALTRAAEKAIERANEVLK